MNKTVNRMNFPAITLMAMLLSACASSGDMREAPSYAVRNTVDTFRVSCGESSPRSSYMRYDAMDVFFHPDGSEKTHEEFCRESRFGWTSRCSNALLNLWLRVTLCPPRPH